MKIEKIKETLIKELKLTKVYIKGNENHIEIIAIGDFFLRKSEVQRQQHIYKPLMNYITNKKIHAITIKAYTIKEWQSKNK
ncbi:BolA/IbaG family iron-sulfur metabolism protein [Buchnera aphidicola (Neophyllaphis podocarpi)]|uniref:BolA family protein n=1 Tax=Buchnera aphidicola TaxID=9 RepID=UPI0031B899A9